MVMPSSGPISMAQAHAEFGLGYSLSAYYGCDEGVPTSGPISLGHLYGKRKLPVVNFIKIYDLTIPGSSQTSNIALYEIEVRTTAGGADYLHTCVDCSPINSSSGNLGRAAISDNQLQTGVSISQGADAYFIFQLTQAIKVRQIGLCGLGINGYTASFKIGGATSQAALTGAANKGTLLGSFTGVPLVSGGFANINL